MRTKLLLFICALSCLGQAAQATSPADAKTIIAGVPSHFPPHYRTTKDGRVEGFAIDVMNWVAADSNLLVRYRIYQDWPATFAALKAGEIQLIPNLGISEKRRSEYAYTQPVETFALRIFVRSSSPEIRSLEELRQRKVVTVAGNVAVGYLSRYPDIDLLVMADIENALFALLSGEVDAFVYPTPWVTRLARASGVEQRIKAVGPPLLEIKRAMALASGQEPLLKQLDTSLGRFLRSRAYQQTYSKWFGREPEYWTTRRVVWTVLLVSLSLLLLVVVAMSFWRYRALVHLNRQLSASIAAKDHAEHQRWATEHKYQALFENAAETIFLLDGQDRLVDCNSKLLQMFKGAKQDFVGKTLLDLSAIQQPSGEASASALATLLGAARRGDSQFFQWQCRRLDGTHFHSEITLINIELGQHENLLQGILRDVSARKVTEDELAQYRDHLEELVSLRTRSLQASNRELETFSYSVAHDLRAPLRAITSFSQIEQKEAHDRLTDDERDMLQRVVKSGVRMAQLIDDILELARISRQEIHEEDVDLSAIGKRIAQRLAHLQPQRQVRWDIQPGLKVSGDASLLEVMLHNLLDNAWKYSRNVPQAQIHFGCKQDDKVVYYVKDNGTGFDMRYSDKLFKPFERLHGVEEFEGNGIGLATVSRVIHRHGGEVWAEADQDKGSTFYFTLPDHH